MNIPMNAPRVNAPQVNASQALSGEASQEQHGEPEGKKDWRSSAAVPAVFSAHGIWRRRPATPRNHHL